MLGGTSLYKILQFAKFIGKALPVLLLIGFIVFGFQSAYAQADQQKTRLDSINVSGGTIMQKDVSMVKQQLTLFANRMLDLRVLQNGVAETLIDLDLTECDNDVIILSKEEELFNLQAQIDEQYIVIVRCCQKLNRLILIDGEDPLFKGKRVLGVLILNDINKYLKDRGYYHPKIF